MVTQGQAVVGLDSFKLEGIQLTDHELGVGSYASVYEVNYLGLKCAGKKIHELLLRQGGGGITYALRRFEEECRLLSRLRHPNIVQFLGVYTERGMQAPILIMEFLPTNLSFCIDNHFSQLRPEISYSILRDVALGLNYLHGQSPPIIHRDLSSNNVLLTSNMMAKISDLGVAKMLGLSPLQASRVMFNTKTPGTPAYMPPEAMTDDPAYDTSIDVFSYGVMMIHVFSGQWPVPKGGQIRMERGRMIPVSEAERLEGYLRAVGDRHPLMDMILRCIDNDRQRRPHSRDIVPRLSDVVSKNPLSCSNHLEMLQQMHADKDKIKKLRRHIETLQARVRRTAESSEKDLGMGAYSSGPTTTHSSSASYHHQPQSAHHFQQHGMHSGPYLPQCQAHGCSNPVHCDYSLPENLRFFCHCSPQCRDNHLLLMERRTLETDIKDLKGKLQTQSTSEVSSVAKSQEGSASSSGGSKSFLLPSFGGGSKKKEKQMTVLVEGRKDKSQPFGLILSKKVHNSHKALGFVIVGAVKGSPAYSLLREGKVRIFDVIEAVGDKSASDLLIPSKDVQECIDMHLNQQVSVKMCINHSISLPPVSKTLDCAHREGFCFTHVVALRYLPTSDSSKHYGLTLSKPGDSHKPMVEGVSRDSSAFHSEVKFGDRICMYSTASTDTISSSQMAQRKKLGSIKHDLEKAFAHKENVILVIQRP